MKFKKDINIITTRFPWPKNNGFANKNYWLIKNLSKIYNVHLIVIQHKIPDSFSFERVKIFCKSIKFFKPSLFDIFFSCVKDLFLGRPLQLSFYYSSKAKKYIANIKSDQVFLISVIRAYQYVEDKNKVFIDMADSISNHYLNYSKKIKFPKNLIYQFEGNRLLNYEINSIKNSIKVYLFNSLDKDIYCSKKVKILTHGVDPILFHERENIEGFSNTLFFIGNLSYPPNHEGLLWFVENVIDELNQNIRLHVIGKIPINFPEKIINHKRIKLLGYVDNPYPMMSSGLANIAPTQSGAGIQNKIIESLALGSLTVVSSFSADAFGKNNNKVMLVCKDKKDWIHNINTAYEEPECFEKLKRMGKEFAINEYSWDKYSDSIIYDIEKFTKK